MMKSNSINVTHPGNPVNDSHVNPSSRHSSFDLSPYLAQTVRFGELTPHLAMMSVPGDHISLRSAHNIRSYTLKAPLMSDLRISKDYFAVPLQAILPFQFDRIYANPNIGDDVPDDAYTNIEYFSKVIYDYIWSLWDAIGANYASYDFTDTTQSDYTSTVESVLRDLFIFFIQAEYFYSDGSLLNTLGYSTTDSVSWFDVAGVRKSFDEVFDTFINTVFGDSVGQIKGFQFGFSSSLGEYFGSEVVRSSLALTSNLRNIRSCLELMRDNGGVYGVDDASWNTSASAIGVFLSDWIDDNRARFVQNDGNNRSCDLARLFAYQIVCAHYYSNDKVDYIYSAELYRQNLLSAITNFSDILGLSVGASNDISTDFSWNGLLLQYDYCSSHFFNSLVAVYATPTDAASVFATGQYLSLIFAFRHSLRFVDYFTGAKTRPLAIGDSSIPVTGGTSVDVIDVTQKIQLQRFRNAVNRTGRKIANYVKGILGVDLAHDYHDPQFLGHVSDSVFGDEVSNTGDAQIANPNSVTSVLKSNSSRYAFEFDCDRQSVIIGISYFDIPRYYSRATDREMHIANRFDMFVPQLEYIGDQPIYDDEISTLGVSGLNFGYTTRYMEFKQKFMRAVGGFVRNLPGYLFLADNVPGQVYPSVLSPSYIRSSNIELDPFYVALEGNSCGSYFHFIVININEVHSNRPMSYNPQIL